MRRGRGKGDEKSDVLVEHSVCAPSRHADEGHDTKQREGGG